MNVPFQGPDGGFARLKRLAQKPAPVERCGLCNVALGGDHRHLVDVQSRRIECACTPCALLFENQSGRSISTPQENEVRRGPRYRLVPRDAVVLRDFALDDLQWEALSIPIDLAFFFYNSASGKVVAFYPSPAGATESLLPLDAWDEIVVRNLRLQQMQPDVEALLVNRVRETREYFIAPIDRCYELVGIIRRYWSGFSGGDEVWRKLAEFFEMLRKASPAGAAHA
jgi:Family of unknown function (DUF5947)